MPANVATQPRRRSTRDTVPGDRLFIRDLARETGVNPSTLRAWERRYGLLRPERTPKGHRLYSHEDIRRVRRILILLEEGHALPAIASRLERQARPEPEQAPGVWGGYVASALEAIAEFSVERLEAVYNETVSLYPVDLITERLIEPLLEALGARWHERTAGIAEEHFFTAWLRNRLGARFHHAVSQCQGPRIVCAGLPGSRHEVGLLLFSLSAMARDYRVVYLGADLPLQQLPHVVRRCAARGVVLGGRDPIEETLHRALARLARRLPVPLMLGGPCSDTALPAFEAAGGVRLGARIPVALRILRGHLPPVSGRRRER